MDIKKAIEEMKSLSPSENAIETVLQALKNSISKKKIEDKIKELNEGIKRDMENYDKIKDESWKKAIYRSMRQKIEVKKFLQELLEDK